MQTTSLGPTDRPADASASLQGGGSRARMDGIQRARLLAAVTEAVAEQGVGGLTVAQVVARAGVSRRTFYELFDDCEDCLLAAIDDTLARLTRCVRDVYDTRADWLVRVRMALASALAYFDAEPGAGQLLLTVLLGDVADSHLRERIVGELVALVDEGRELTRAGPQLPALTAEGVVGGVLSVLHVRLARSDRGPALELFGPLMGMIALPYLGASAARRESSRPVPSVPAPSHARNPLGELGMRLTYRTVCVLAAVAANPGASNRTIAQVAEVPDQGQMSKLLSRLHSAGLIANAGGGTSRGEPNAWALTERGWRVQEALAAQHRPHSR